VLLRLCVFYEVCFQHFIAEILMSQSVGVSNGEPVCFGDKFMAMFCYAMQRCDSFEQGRFLVLCSVVSCFRGVIFLHFVCR
jgi:hypothetical protein